MQSFTYTFINFIKNHTCKNFNYILRYLIFQGTHQLLKSRFSVIVSLKMHVCFVFNNYLLIRNDKISGLF